MLRKILFCAAMLSLAAPWQTSSAAAAVPSGPYLLGAAPRESTALGRKIYDPLAAYLSKVLGRRVVYRPAGSWGVYQGLMQQSHYDLVIDGPQFTGWRIKKRGYTALVRISGPLRFALIVRRHSPMRTLDDLAGASACDPPPPGLVTLMLQSLFSPVTPPHIVPTHGPAQAFRYLLARRCAMSVVPMTLLKKLDPDGVRTRVIVEPAALPNFALSSGPRLSAAQREAVRAAMLSPAALGPLAQFRRHYMPHGHFVASGNARYLPEASLLDGLWGY